MADDENPKRILCFATNGGPSGGEWIFDVSGASPKLLEAWSWAETS